MITNQSRDTSVDVFKGIVILLMIIGHTRIDENVIAYIYLFHMPALFILSGYMFNAGKIKTIEGLVRFSWRRFSRLLLTAIFWNCVFILCQNFLLDIKVYTDNPAISDAVVHRINWESECPLLYGLASIRDTQLGGAMWFLKSLFWSSLIYALVEFGCRIIRVTPIIVQSIIACLCIYNIYCPSKSELLDKVFWIIRGDDTLKAFIMFHIGVVLNLLRNWFRPCKPSMFIKGNNFMVLLITALFLLGSLVLSCDVRSMGANRLLAVALYIVNGTVGWFMLMSASRLVLLLTRKTKGNYIVLCLQYLGRNTMPIVVFHFLAFKIINALGVALFKYPSRCISAFPTAYSGILWSFVYTVFAILFCLGLGYIWDNIKNGVIKNVWYFKRSF